MHAWTMVMRGSATPRLTMKPRPNGTRKSQTPANVIAARLSRRFSVASSASRLQPQEGLNLDTAAAQPFGDGASALEDIYSMPVLVLAGDSWHSSRQPASMILPWQRFKLSTR